MADTFNGRRQYVLVVTPPDECAGEGEGEGKGGGEDDDPEQVRVVVRHAAGETTLYARRGRVLRDVLREHDRSPYTRLTERANCGGRGLCATCGVRLRVGPEPSHWHDRLAERFGYPRLSCQVRVEEGMVVELDEEKVVWGKRESG